MANKLLKAQGKRDMTPPIHPEQLRALSQMASGMAHDINNSLTPIIGYSDFLLDPRSGLPEDSRAFLQSIRTAAADIADLVEQVRRFYRRQDQAETLSQVDLNSVVQQVVEAAAAQCAQIAQKRGIHLQIDLDAGANLPVILGNESELREAFTHVVQNAIEALPKGGTITIETGAITQEGSSAPPETVFLQVRDNGVGMDELTQQRCFEPFFSTKGRAGNGLGLAIVYGVMRRHGGTVELESRLGAGTSIRLGFPNRVPSAHPLDPNRAGGRSGFEPQSLASAA